MGRIGPNPDPGLALTLSLPIMTSKTRKSDTLGITMGRKGLDTPNGIDGIPIPKNRCMKEQER